MPAMYDKAGLCFEYPESWLLDWGKLLMPSKERIR